MNLFYEDIDSAVEALKPILGNCKGGRFFLSGGTGFFGKWLLATLSRANVSLNLDFKIFVLTRDSSSFIEKFPEFNLDGIRFVDGDIQSFKFNEKADFVIHAATEASASLNRNNPILMADTIINGTRNILDYAKFSKVRRFLFISSGAVYGAMPYGYEKFDEDMLTSPDCLNANSAYSEAKRTAELYCALYSKEFNIDFSSARCFAFVGPYLNLDIHFAVGNFIKNVIENKDIVINGNGLPVRSYMYMSDLAVWLITILLNGKNANAYNVGSDQGFSIKDIAQKVIDNSDRTHLKVLVKGAPEENNRNIYLPSVDKAKKMLDLKVTVDIDTAIKRTIKWNLDNVKN